MLPLLLSLYSLCISEALTVHIVPHTHDDVGWLKTVDEYYSGANNSIQHAGVRYILDSVQTALAQNPDRKFTYVEQAFFQRWWREQSESSRALTRGQVANGQLNFVNGGWCMHDEAAAHYIAMVDQTTLGHRLLLEQFDVVPTVGWQLDPFGHSATQAALLSAEAGMDALFFGRIDYQDLDKRLKEQRAEFIWRASPSLGQDAQVFAGLTGSYGGNYGPPGGFNWNVDSNDEPIEDNLNLATYNLPSRVNDFVRAALAQGARTRGDNVLWTMGSDFQYESAENWFLNLDKIIKAVNRDGRVQALYSSPAQYAEAKRAEAASGKVVWPLETGDNSDFFPYADGPHQFWTGYFTSRPALKRYVYTSSAIFNAARQVQALTPAGRQLGVAGLQTFEEALGVNQHHDGVSGTAKQHVAFDYARRMANGQTQAEGVVSEGLSTLLAGSAWTNTWSFCRRLNESVCSASQTSASSTVAIWNQLAQPRTETISLPVGSPKVSVTDAATGKSVPVQVIPADETVTNYARQTGEANFTAVFQVTLPPVGVAAYQLSSSGASEPLEPLAAMQADVVLENELVALTFSGTTGRIASWINKATGTKIAIDQNFCYYRSNRGDSLSGQPSGAYIFRPETNTSCIPVNTGAAVISFVNGSIVQEVRQTFGPWISQTVRLAAGARHAEFAFTVGPVELPDPSANHTEEQCVSWRQTSNCDPNGPREPQNDKPCSAFIGGSPSGFCECFNGRRASPVGCGHAGFTCQQACLYLVGKEVVSRFSTSIASAGGMLTDSNGRELLHRKRDYRPLWNLSQTEPVAGNYFPCNSVAAIKDSQAQLSVLVDASQGVGSITDGSMEFMVHRRLIFDDYRGVGEPLNETQTTWSYASPLPGAHDGPGLVIRGRHWVSVEPPASAMSVVRPLQERLFAQPLLWFSQSTSSSPMPTLSGLVQPLPPNVQLMTLQALDASTLLVRLAHLFGVGEDPTLSQPVSVDLGNLFDPTHSFRVVSIKEVSLTNNQDKSEILRKRKRAAEWHSKDGVEPHSWRFSRPFQYPGDASVTLGPLEIKAFVFTIEN